MNRFLLINLLIVICFVVLSPLQVFADDGNSLMIIRRIFKSEELKKLSGIYYKLDNKIDINREFVKKLNPEIKELYLSEMLLSGEKFYEIYSDKLNFNELRSGCKGMVVLAEFYRRDKKHKVSLKILKHLISFSIAMAQDAVNYGKDGTGSLLQYMISISLSNIVLEYTAKIIYNKDFSKKEFEDFSNFLQKAEKTFPDYSGAIKSEELGFADFIKKAKKHETGIYTLIGEMNEISMGSKGQNPMDVSLLELLKKSDDARYVYDLYMDDALNEMKSIYSLIYSTKNKYYRDVENTFLELDKNLSTGKTGRNFLCLLAIPNFKRAKEIEVGLRAKFRILAQVAAFLAKNKEMSELQKNVTEKGIKDPWSGREVICHSSGGINFVGCGFKDESEMDKYIPESESSKEFFKKRLETWQCLFSFKDGFIK